MNEEDRLLTTKRALGLAIEICRLHPEYAITGSLALILYGYIEPRPVHDIDLVIHTPQETLEEMKSNSALLFGDSGKDDIFTYSVTTSQTTQVGVHTPMGKIILPVRHDLFHMSDKYQTVLVHGIKVHGLPFILDAKEAFHRLKDQLDISQFKSRGYLLPFPEELLPSKESLI